MFFKEGRRREPRRDASSPPLQGSLKQTLQSTLVIYKILEKTLVL
jgi:hypothetical protein